MNIAIIGANSLLASYIIELLNINEEHQLTLFGRTEQKLANMTSKFIYFNYPEQSVALVDLLAFDTIVYCAASGVQANRIITTSLVYEVNAFFPINIINYLSDKQFAGTWISFGSYFEIGDNGNLQAFNEEEVATSNLKVPNHYCASKRLLTRFIQQELFNIRAYHLLLPTIYGKRENATRLIPYLVNALRKGQLPQLSKGTQVRQYVHCRDVATLVQELLYGQYTSGIYNVVNEEPIRIAKLVQDVFSAFNQDANLYFGTLNTRDESMQYLALTGAKLAQTVRAWQPNISLQAGIEEYLY